MKLKLLTVIVVVLASCTSKETSNKLPIVGTWKLVSGTLIEKGDTVVTDYTKGQSFIKVINNTHFAFMLHDLNGGKDSTAVFASGGGKYTLTDDNYTEHLEYCTDRQWEGHDFAFKITVQNDTLTQKGFEEVAGAGVSRMNIERYVRVSAP